MSQKVTIASGKRNVQLPDGKVYSAGDVVTLTDAQFAQLDSGLFPATLIDGGYVDDRPVTGQRLPSFTTAGRPSASAKGAGWSYWDTTLGKPVWSNGTLWKDAAGTTV